MNLNSIISNQLNHEKSATMNNVMSVKALNSVKQIKFNRYTERLRTPAPAQISPCALSNVLTQGMRASVYWLCTLYNTAAGRVFFLCISDCTVKRPSLSTRIFFSYPAYVPELYKQAVEADFSVSVIVCCNPTLCLTNRFKTQEHAATVMIFPFIPPRYCHSNTSPVFVPHIQLMLC